MNIEHQIEAILFFKNEPVKFEELASILHTSIDEIRNIVAKLGQTYAERGLILLTDGEKVCFGTNPQYSDLIETLQKEELSRDIGRAGLETLAIILYKGPVSRREIDYIRGVNSGFILRNLLIRGLVERTEIAGERSYSYKPTLELFEYLGVKSKEDLPEFASAYAKLVEFAATEATPDEKSS